MGVAAAVGQGGGSEGQGGGRLGHTGHTGQVKIGDAEAEAEGEAETCGVLTMVGSGVAEADGD